MDPETDVLLYRLENGVLVIMGDVDGEKNGCWRVPADESAAMFPRL